MTGAFILPAGAPSARTLSWQPILWDKAEKHVRRLQMRIAKAFREKRYGRAKALQWLLTHSHYAKLLAVRRVTQNKGRNTPGVDKVTWKTPKQKMQAVQSLKRRGYNALPLRRIYIPKKQKGKLRPLSIPTMLCRAQQALHLQALEPIAEMMADKHAYGFRPKRSTADAVEQCFNALARRGSPKFILEADIKSCFDKISHSWLEDNIPMDKAILKKWLQAGFIENNEVHATTFGTPQGGVSSPTILNVTLSGLEQAVHKAAPNNRKHKVHFSMYADDFIITGATREVLKQRVMPVVEDFLRERGLSLSKEKTKITHIKEGFDFLGMTLRKYQEKLIIKPSKANVKAFLADIKEVIYKHRAAKTENLIYQLNSKIRGWTNYFKHVCSKQTFLYISYRIFQMLWRWAKRRHPEKSRLWVRNKYYRSTVTRGWIFSTKVKKSDGKTIILDLFEAGKVPIRRHIKIKGDATPYDPAYIEYFARRARKKTYAPNGASTLSFEEELGDL